MRHHAMFHRLMFCLLGLAVATLACGCGSGSGGGGAAGVGSTSVDDHFSVATTEGGKKLYAGHGITFAVPQGWQPQY